MKKNGTRFIAEMGIYVALGLVFDIIAGVIGFKIWPNGGSISIAMLPIFMMSFRYGLKGGLISGFLIGSIQLLWSKDIVHWSQALLEYSIAYGILGIAGLFSKAIYKNKDNWKSTFYSIISITIGGSLRLILHIVSGVLFFSQGLLDEGKSLLFIWGYSITYNLSYMIPSMIICMIIIRIIIRKYYHLIEYTEVNFN